MNGSAVIPMQSYPEPFGIKYDGEIRQGTAELYNWREMDSPVLVLFFHDETDYRRWLNGESFRLINHWTREAPKPQYDKAERMKRKR